MSRLVVDLTLLTTHNSVKSQEKTMGTYNHSITYSVFAQIKEYNPNASILILKPLPFINDNSTTIALKFDDDTIWNTNKYGMIKGLPVQCKIVPIIEYKHQAYKKQLSENDNDRYYEDKMATDEPDLKDQAHNHEITPKFKIVRCLEIDMNILDMETFQMSLIIQNMANKW